MPVRSRIAFAVPNSLKNELQTQIIQDGYGLRGKSKWIAEAVEQLLALKDFFELVDYSDEMHGFNKIEIVVINYSLKLKLDGAITQIKKEFPNSEGIQSRIMRTAILQRILRT